MTTIVLSQPVPQGLDLERSDLFLDITDLGWSYGPSDQDPSFTNFEFNGDLTDEQIMRVNWRLWYPINQDSMMEGLYASLQNLRSVRESADDLDLTSLSDAVRALAKNQIQLILFRLGIDESS